jgi:ribonuclease P protein component
MLRNTFTKEEKLKSRSAINSLFEQGSAELYTYPLKVKYILHVDDQSPLPKIAVMVPKRKFKNAVDRNTLKRRIKEAYRLNNHALKATSVNNKCTLEMMFMYISATEEQYPAINKAVIKLISQLTSKIDNVHTSN